MPHQHLITRERREHTERIKAFVVDPNRRDLEERLPGRMGMHQRRSRGTQRYRGLFDQIPWYPGQWIKGGTKGGEEQVRGGKKDGEPGEQKAKEIPVHMPTMSHDDETPGV